MLHLVRTSSANGVKLVSKNCALKKNGLAELKSKLLEIEQHLEVLDELVAVSDVELNLHADL